MRGRGIHIPPAERVVMARRAYEMREAGASKLDIEVELDVSMPTVRNLIAAGRRLAEQEGAS